MALCRPRWAVEIEEKYQRPRRVIRSGCPTEGGKVKCAPGTMRQAAERSVGFPVSLDQYTLARYTASERGSGTPEEKMLLALLARRRAAMRNQSVHRLLACTNVWNECVYGPINVMEGAQPTAPYGRWASTSRDPGVDDLVIAGMALSGRFDGFAQGADDQWSARIIMRAREAREVDPVGWVYERASLRNYWVGPIIGVNHFEVFAFRRRPDLDPQSPEGQQLIAATVAALRRSPPDWSRLAACPLPGRFADRSPGRLAGTILSGVALVGAVATIVFAARAPEPVRPRRRRPA